jgi:hypothetical protein
MADIDPSGVQVVQSVEPADVQIGRGDNANGAVALAGALADTSPQITSFITELGGQLQAKAANKAQADAFASSGEAFKDAVADGRIEPTQNPWYIKAYNLNSAQVRGTAAMATLVDQSQTWQERNDPAAYEARMAKEMGGIAQGFQQHPESLQGFENAANPAYSRAISLNQEYNATRIQTEHVQNVSTLMTSMVQQVAAQNGGVLSPENAQAALKPLVDQWVSTGGSPTQARMLMLGAVTGAAYNTGNSGLLDVLNQDFDGKGPLANISDASGKPIAGDLATDRYRIERLIGMQGTAAQKAHAQAILKEGQAAYDDLQAAHGWDFNEGKLTEPMMMEEMKAKGYSPAGASMAIRLFKDDAAGINSLAQDLNGMHAINPDAQLGAANLVLSASTTGLSPALRQRTFDALRTGMIDTATFDKIVETGAKVDERNANNARSDARQAKSDSRADAREQMATARQEAIVAKDYTKGAVGKIVDNAVKFNDRSYLSNPALYKELEVTAVSAQTGYLHDHPGDYLGAETAVDQAVIGFDQHHAHGRRGGTPPPVAPPAKTKGGNPLGSTY